MATVAVLVDVAAIMLLHMHHPVAVVVVICSPFTPHFHPSTLQAYLKCSAPSHYMFCSLGCKSLSGLMTGCCEQEHEVWLEEPQEMTNFDSSKTDPLLEDSSQAKQDGVLKPVKEGKQGRPPGSTLEGDVTDSITQKRVADKLSQV